MILFSLLVSSDFVYGHVNSKNMIAIKTINGNYLCAEDGGASKLVADRDKIADWETFELIDLGRGKLVADRKKVGDWESFELIKVEDIKLDKCTLTAISNDKNVTLSWTKPINERGIIGYKLYRGTAPGKYSNTPITDFPIQDTSYKDKNIENKTTYYYIVKAVYKDKSIGDASNEVSIKSRLENTKIVLEVGSKYMVIDGREQEIDPGKGTRMIIKNGRTFLPIRAVIEAMDGEVEWDGLTKQVTITLDN